MPPFLHNGKFTEAEVLETYNIASVRIHIERLFARLKMYGILNKITIDLLPFIYNIVHMCCVLTIYQHAISNYKTIIYKFKGSLLILKIVNIDLIFDKIICINYGYI